MTARSAPHKDEADSLGFGKTNPYGRQAAAVRGYRHGLARAYLIDGHASVDGAFDLEHDRVAGERAGSGSAALKFRSSQSPDKELHHHSED